MKVLANERMRLPLMVLSLLTLLGLPVLAQQTTKKPAETKADSKEKVKLMEEGQATLLEATQIAEKHTKGRALEVDCRIQKVAVPQSEKKAPNEGEGRQDVLKSRLMYRIDCFGQDKTMIAEVDGLEKKVIDVKEVDVPPSKDD